MKEMYQSIEYIQMMERIRSDRREAEKALLMEQTNKIDQQAAALVLRNTSRKDRCLIYARRAAQKMRKSRGGWVIQTQLQYIHKAETAGFKNEKDLYLSESQIKRKWKQLVELTADIAGRI